jgi:hypothetical protein
LLEVLLCPGWYIERIYQLVVGVMAGDFVGEAELKEPASISPPLEP